MRDIPNKNNKLQFIKTIVKNNAHISYSGTSSGIIALASAKAAQMLKSKVFHATVFVSPLIYINSAHIGVPRLGRCGMKKMAIAGFVSKKPLLGLHVLQSLTKQDIAKIEQYAKNPTLVNVEVQYNTGLIYCRVIAVDDKGNVADVKIEHQPTYFTSIKLNSVETVDPMRFVKKVKNVGFEGVSDVWNYVTIKEAYELVKKFKLSELKFIDEHIKVNKHICDEGAANLQKDSISHHYSQAFDVLQNKNSEVYSKDGWINRLCQHVIAGIDARMNGTPCPTITSATNGDHGIVAVMVPYYYAQEFNIPKEKLYQAIMLSHFITWRISTKIGKLTIMCGTAIAATAGALAAVAYMRGIKWDVIQRSLNIHLCQQAGTLCFGSSPSCALKVLSSLIAGFYTIEYAEMGGKVPNKDGFIEDDIEKTLNNLEKYTTATNAESTVPIVESYQKAEDK